jgi:hypothetical protein
MPLRSAKHVSPAVSQQHTLSLRAAQRSAVVYASAMQDRRTYLLELDMGRLIAGVLVCSVLAHAAVAMQGCCRYQGAA